MIHRVERRRRRDTTTIPSSAIVPGVMITDVQKIRRACSAVR